MRSETAALAFLTRYRARWIAIDASILPADGGGAVVASRHRLHTGHQLQQFSIRWPDLNRVDTEYGLGLSVIHDVKDHYFYGLGITHLTEFQTIVQTYFGRTVAEGEHNLVDGGDYRGAIEDAIRAELLGPRGPRVYGPEERGLLEVFCPGISAADRTEAEQHMRAICFDLIMPRVEAAYKQSAPLRWLQASTLDQPALVDAYLKRVVWRDRERRLMSVGDNMNLRVNVRAFIDEGLAAMTSAIAREIEEYGRIYGLDRFGPVFSIKGYVVGESACESAS